MAPDVGLSEFLLGSRSKEKILRNSMVPGLFSVIVGGKTIRPPRNMLAGTVPFSPQGIAGGSSISWFWTLLPFFPFPTPLRSPNRSDAFILLFRFSHTPSPLFRQAIDDLEKGRYWRCFLNGEEKKPIITITKYYGKYYQATSTEGKRS